MYAMQILSDQWAFGLTGLRYIDPYPHQTSGLHIPGTLLWNYDIVIIL